jgi:hypothetical protein
MKSRRAFSGWMFRVDIGSVPARNGQHSRPAVRCRAKRSGARRGFTIPPTPLPFRRGVTSDASASERSEQARGRRLARGGVGSGSEASASGRNGRGSRPIRSCPRPPPRAPFAGGGDVPEGGTRTGMEPAPAVVRRSSRPTHPPFEKPPPRDCSPRLPVPSPPGGFRDSIRPPRVARPRRRPVAVLHLVVVRWWCRSGSRNRSRVRLRLPFSASPLPILALDETAPGRAHAPRSARSGTSGRAAPFARGRVS